MKYLIRYAKLDKHARSLSPGTSQSAGLTTGADAALENTQMHIIKDRDTRVYLKKRS